MSTPAPLETVEALLLKFGLKFAKLEQAAKHASATPAILDMALVQRDELVASTSAAIAALSKESKTKVGDGA